MTVPGSCSVSRRANLPARRRSGPPEHGVAGRQGNGHRGLEIVVQLRDVLGARVTAVQELPVLDGALLRC